ncbi:polymorphic toxin type 27 domain-containing protein, partial [Streptomyces sp. NPDC096319]|uniref:polymorphic toxin type 27 domain-containing protein n=1 Tax=Streptomyces sp. NPDC096319 TaxID=3366084 RepID=UPI0038281DA5
KDAANARAVATKAEEDAASARATATKAESDATAAETAASHAREAAEEAQAAADRTETTGDKEQISQGLTTGIGDVWVVLDHIEYIGEPTNVVKKNCNPIIHIGDCTITATVTYKSHVDVYMCAASPETYFGRCPQADTVYLGREVTDPNTEQLSYTLSMVEFNSGIDPVDVLLGDFIGCAKKITPGGESGSWGDCAWAASWFVAGPLFRAGKAAVYALDAALRTGIGFMDAYRALRTIGLTEAAVQGILSRIFRKAGEACQVAAPGTMTLASFKVTSLAASSANDELIEKCRRILKDIVKDGDHIVLGVNPPNAPGSDALAKSLGARTFNNGDYGILLPEEMGMGVRPIWTVGVEESLMNSNVKISVSLDGVEGAKTADEALTMLLQRGETITGNDWKTIRSGGYGTAWEMIKLRAALRLGYHKWDSIKWYMIKRDAAGKEVLDALGKPVWEEVHPTRLTYATGVPLE